MIHFQSSSQPRIAIFQGSRSCKCPVVVMPARCSPRVSYVDRRICTLRDAKTLSVAFDAINASSHADLLDCRYDGVNSTLSWCVDCLVDTGMKLSYDHWRILELPGHEEEVKALPILRMSHVGMPADSDQSRLCEYQNLPSQREYRLSREN